MYRFLLIFVFLMGPLLAEPKVGDLVEVDNYDGSGNYPAYMGKFRIQKIDSDGTFYGKWEKVPEYFKLEGKAPTNYTSCDHAIECRKEQIAKEETYIAKQKELEEQLNPSDYFSKFINHKMFTLQKDLQPGDIADVCYFNNAECDPEAYSRVFTPAKIIKKTDNGYEVSVRVFDNATVGGKVRFSDKKVTVRNESIRLILPESAPGTELTEDMLNYEVVQVGTLVDSKLNGKWYKAVISSQVGNGGLIKIIYINWGDTEGYFGLKNPIYEIAPYGSKTKGDTGAFSGLPFPSDSRGASVIDVSGFKKNKKCPSSMPYVSNGICVNELGQWKGSSPIRP